MRKLLGFLLWVLPALALVSLLPVYPRRTMTRSQVTGHAGDVIAWGFELRSLPGFFDGYAYMRPEEHPTANLVAALALAALLASALAFAAARLWARRRRAGAASQGVSLILASIVLVIGLPASAAAQGLGDPSHHADAGASSEARPDRADSDEVTVLEEQIARDDAMLSTDNCAVACQALASMQRSVERLCALEPGPMCVRARAKARDAAGRVRAACPECGLAGGEAPLADARPPESAPASAPPQTGRGCAGCTIGADERGSAGAITLALAWALASSIRRRSRRT